MSDDKGSIIVDENTGKQSTESDEEDKYNDFVALLPKTSPGSQSEPRWAVYDLEYEKDGGKRNKLVFIIWYTRRVSVLLLPRVLNVLVSQVARRRESRTEDALRVVQRRASSLFGWYLGRASGYGSGRDCIWCRCVHCMLVSTSIN